MTVKKYDPIELKAEKTLALYGGSHQYSSEIISDEESLSLKCGKDQLESLNLKVGKLVPDAMSLKVGKDSIR